MFAYIVVLLAWPLLIWFGILFNHALQLHFRICCSSWLERNSLGFQLSTKNLRLPFASRATSSFKAPVLLSVWRLCGATRQRNQPKKNTLNMAASCQRAWSRHNQPLGSTSWCGMLADEWGGHCHFAGLSSSSLWQNHYMVGDSFALCSRSIMHLAKRSWRRRFC